MKWPEWASLWSSSASEKRDGTVNDKQGAVPSPSSAANVTSHVVQSTKPLHTADWSRYTTTQTLTVSVLTTATTLALIRLWKRYLRRIPTASYLKPDTFRQRNLYGYVTRVGDGDNFHFFHTPGGKLMGWGWAPRRKVEDMFAQAKGGQTLHVRIAGVDAPEMAHFGRPEQAFAKEALEWLRGALLNSYVRIYPYRPDQYGRVVCSVYQRKWVVLKSDVGLEMLKRGLATVYEAKFGSEYGDREETYRAAEATAKDKKIGMWQQPGLVARILGQSKTKLESPREYKTRMAKREKSADMAK